MNIQTALVIEKLFFNILMYLIVAAGGYVVLSAERDAGSSIENNWFIIRVAIATFIGAALCHYFHHLSASYLALEGGGGFQKYETAREKHAFNSAFVVAVNVCMVLVFTRAVVVSCFAISSATDGAWFTVSTTIALAVFVLVAAAFALAPEFAKRGWPGAK